MGMCADYRSQLEASMQDEICDAGFYAQIAEEAPTEELRELIISIVGDEYAHARIWTAMLQAKELCQHKPCECK